MSTMHLFDLCRHLLSGFSSRQVGFLVAYIMHVMWAPGVHYPFMSYRYELLFMVFNVRLFVLSGITDKKSP